MASSGGTTEVRIKPKKHWPFLVLGFPFLLLWTTAGVWGLVRLLASGDFSSSTFAAVIVWLIVEINAAYALSWNAFGEEVVSFYDERLTIGRRVFGLGHTRSWAVSEVEDVRVGGTNGDTVELKIRRKRRDLLTPMDKRDSERVVQVLRAYVHRQSAG